MGGVGYFLGMMGKMILAETWMNEKNSVVLPVSECMHMGMQDDNVVQLNWTKRIVGKDNSEE